MSGDKKALLKVRPGREKRRADVPKAARQLGEKVSKADLLEAAWWLAALACDGGVDDETSTLERLLEELNTIRANRGARAVRFGLPTAPRPTVAEKGATST